MVTERENSGEKEEKAKMTRKADQQRKINQKRRLWHEGGRTARDDTATAQAVSGGVRGGNNTTCTYYKELRRMYDSWQYRSMYVLCAARSLACFYFVRFGNYRVGLVIHSHQRLLR